MDSNGINDALALIQRTLKLGKRATNIQYEEALQAAREAIVDQKELVLNCREENRELKEKLTIVKDFTLDKHVYWASNDHDRTQPFCPSCMAKGLKMPMEPTYKNTKDSGFTCPNQECGHYSDPWDWDSRQPRNTIKSQPWS